jgi:hypothetical protein
MTETLPPGVRRLFDAAIERDVACLSSLVSVATANPAGPMNGRPRSRATQRGLPVDGASLRPADTALTPPVLAIDADLMAAQPGGSGTGRGRRSYR